MKKLLLIVLTLALAGSGFLFWRTQSLVKQRFEGRLWELPARIYARPLTLYNGLKLNRDLFEKELALLGYNRTGGSSPGSYRCRGDRVNLDSRSFDFGDEAVPAQHIEFVIKDGIVTGLGAAPPGQQVAPKDLIRLEPVLLGNFYPASGQDRVIVTLDALPPLLVPAIVAVEDRSFYTHHGINVKAVFRAIAVNIKAGQWVQGASTLSQQLAKNFFLSPEKTLTRKLNEALVAVVMEQAYDKEMIVEAYVNEVYLGQQGNRAIHGFGLAAPFYFGKPLRDLAPHETALLVGMLKGPSAYDPRRHPQRALDRRNTVLEIMREQAVISDAVYETARQSPLGVVAEPRHGGHFPAYLDLVKRQLLRDYKEEDLRSMGLTIFTAMDPQVQLAAGRAAREQLGAITRSRGIPARGLEAGVVVADTRTAEVQAVVGGSLGFNRALDARRAIGSLIKPVICLAALDTSYTLISPLEDRARAVPLGNGRTWTPGNFDHREHGRVALAQALIHSYNLAMVDLGLGIGLEAVADTWKALGGKLDGPLYPAMLLGAVSATPYGVAQVYQGFASGGFPAALRSIRSVYTSRGDLLARYSFTLKAPVDPEAVYLVNWLMGQVTAQGTGKSLANWLPRRLNALGKTGTSNDYKDAWFAGVAGNHLAVVWTGRDDNTSSGLTGATGALPIFGALMKTLDPSPQDPLLPQGVEFVSVDPQSLTRVPPSCTGAESWPFIRGTAPEKTVPCPGGGEKGGVINWLKKVFK